MASILKGKPVIILVQLAVALGFLSLPFLIAPGSSFSAEMLGNKHVQADLLSYLFALAFFYLSFYWFIPAFYHKKRYWAFSLLCLLFFLLIVVVPVLIFDWNIKPHKVPLFNPELASTPEGEKRISFFTMSPYRRFFFEFIQNFFNFLIAFLISFLLSIRNRLRQAEKEKLSAELSYLKAQINPHFLFNTLNSIYSLAIQRSEETAEAVVKLSGMMRYITTETHKEYVALEKELDYIRNYIELQRIRLGNTVAIDFKIEGSSLDQEITPLILITFVENAFKYGVNPEEDCRILIHIRIVRTELRMDVKNTKVTIDFGEESRTGLGIKNARQRLKLSYPGKHELLISDQEKEYSVSLVIKMQ